MERKKETKPLGPMTISSDQGEYNYSNYEITHDNCRNTYATRTLLLLALIKQSLRFYPRHCQPLYLTANKTCSLQTTNQSL